MLGNRGWIMCIKSLGEENRLITNDFISRKHRSHQVSRQYGIRQNAQEDEGFSVSVVIYNQSLVLVEMHAKISTPLE